MNISFKANSQDQQIRDKIQQAKAFINFPVEDSEDNNKAMTNRNFLATENLIAAVEGIADRLNIQA